MTLQQLRDWIRGFFSLNEYDLPDLKVDEALRFAFEQVISTTDWPFLEAVTDAVSAAYLESITEFRRVVSVFDTSQPTRVMRNVEWSTARYIYRDQSSEPIAWSVKPAAVRSGGSHVINIEVWPNLSAAQKNVPRFVVEGVLIAESWPTVTAGSNEQVTIRGGGPSTFKGNTPPQVSRLMGLAAMRHLALDLGMETAAREIQRQYDTMLHNLLNVLTPQSDAPIRYAGGLTPGFVPSSTDPTVPDFYG